MRRECAWCWSGKDGVGMEKAELELGGVMGIGGGNKMGSSRGRKGGVGDPRTENSQLLKCTSVAQKIDWDARYYIVMQIPTIASQLQHTARRRRE